MTASLLEHVDEKRFAETVKLIEHWASELRRRATAEESFWLALELRASEGSTTARAAEEARKSKQRRPLTRKERLRVEREQARARAMARAQRNAERAALRLAARGFGAVCKCAACGKIFRGDRCPRCSRVRRCERCNHVIHGGPNAECKRCAKDPAMLTARGQQTRAALDPEPLPPFVTITRRAMETAALIDHELPDWARTALYRRYRWREPVQRSASELGIPPRLFLKRCEAAVLLLMLALADGPRL